MLLIENNECSNLECHNHDFIWAKSMWSWCPGNHGSFCQTLTKTSKGNLGLMGAEEGVQQAFLLGLPMVYHSVLYTEALWGSDMAESQMEVPNKGNIHHTFLAEPNFQVWMYSYNKVWAVIAQMDCHSERAQACRLRNNRLQSPAHKSLMDSCTRLSPHQGPHHSTTLENHIIIQLHTFMF